MLAIRVQHSVFHMDLYNKPAAALGNRKVVKVSFLDMPLTTK